MPARSHLTHFLISTCLVLLGLFTSSCAGAGGDASLLVACASGLSPAMREIGPAFKALHGISVTFSFSSSGNLAQQIRNGGPFDLFISADAKHLDELIDEGLLVPETRTVVAEGRLVLAFSAASEIEPGPLSMLADADVSRLVMANPEHAPYGMAARQALDRAGLWQLLQPKIVYAESVMQAALFVESGDAPLGLLAKATALATGLEFSEVETRLYDTLEHVAAVQMTSQKRSEAQEFIRFLLSPEGLAYLSAYGLSPPTE